MEPLASHPKSHLIYKKSFSCVIFKLCRSFISILFIKRLFVADYESCWHYFLHWTYHEMTIIKRFPLSISHFPLFLTLNPHPTRVHGFRLTVRSINKSPAFNMKMVANRVIIICRNKRFLNINLSYCLSFNICFLTRPQWMNDGLYNSSNYDVTKIIQIMNVVRTKLWK